MIERGERDHMILSAVLFLVLALGLLVLGFAGVVRGASGIAAVALLVSLVLSAGWAASSLWQRRIRA
jgi:uncharacterized membrane protein YtjA (UPF0391 family)